MLPPPRHHPLPDPAAPLRRRLRGLGLDDSQFADLKVFGLLAR
jgi:hypothetical protein